MEEEEKPAFYIRIYNLITFSYHLLLLYTLSFDCREAFVARQAARGPHFLYIFNIHLNYLILFIAGKLLLLDKQPVGLSLYALAKLTLPSTMSPLTRFDNHWNEFKLFWSFTFYYVDTDLVWQLFVWFSQIQIVYFWTFRCWLRWGAQVMSTLDTTAGPLLR